ncbi:type III secretion system inner rod subunit SctI [Thalassomonas viridans]|uniref:Type III secretion system inner rod subunit SctI n=1 Tax=Thalassomonas viridans TaxID=137584 RepID=A0AAE9YYB2_9GAMM|nr:type III secretion system inner rod subunit SctI [Thalassomonas viridans]WDE02797.1 type III secretion system inner rod subunit SctI [Thalassomonas viridans]
MATEAIGAVKAIETLAVNEAQGPAVPPPADVARMEAAMNNGQQQHRHQVEQAMPLEEISTKPPSDEQGSNIGDKVLDGLEKIKNVHEAEVESINVSLATPDLDVQSLMGLQMKLSRLSLQQDLIAKTASKSTQNLDTLLKTQ